jgi:uncharacterized phage protein gp47/JayE
MADDPDVPQPIIPPVSDLGMQAKSQLRLIIAAIAGSLVLRHVLPDWIVTDQTVDLAVGGVLVAGASAWAWVRTRFIHSALVSIAKNDDVPNAVARMPTKTNPPTV